MANASGGNAYVPGGGGGGAAISAAGGVVSSGTLVFSNSNGVSFGLNGSTITATVTPGAAAGIAAIQLPNTTYTSGTAIFSNANGFSFGSSAGGGITGSYTVPGATVFSNSNNISFGLNGSTVTASANPGVSAISAGTTSVAAGNVVLSNSNGVSFGLNGSTVTASYNSTSAVGQGTTFAGTNVSASMTLNTAGVNLALSAAAGGGGGVALSAAGSSQNAGTVVFSNSNGVSFGMNGSTVTGSVAAQSSLSFSNLNGVTFGIAGSTLTASVAAGGDSPNISAGTTSGNLGSIVFSNSNGVSFGLNGSTITASASGAGASASVFALGNTTAQSSSNTVALSALNFSFSGVVSGGMSGNTLVISSPGTTNFANLSVSAGTTSGSLGSLVFSNSNGVSFGLNGSTITASAAAGGGAALSAAGSSQNAGTVVFSNSNGVSFGMNGSTITASAALQSNQTLGLYALGNTTQNSSTTLDARTLSFNALGAMTMGYTNGSIQVSAPATSSISGTGQVSVAVNGSTISIGAPNYGTLSYWDNDVSQASVSATQLGLGSIYIQGMALPANLSMSALRQFVSGSFSSSSNSSYAGTVSLQAGIYTRNGSTLSLASSGSQSYAFTNTSNNSTASLSGLRDMTVPLNASLTPGNYWLALWSSTASANANWYTLSNVFQSVAAIGYSGRFGAASNASNQLEFGQGIWSTTSAALPSSIGFSNITGTGANSQPLVNLYNISA